MYRNPIHVDVFRVLPGRSATKVTWLKDDSKKVVNEALDALKSSTSPDVTPGAPGVGSKGGGGPNVDAVQSGEAGIAGLARALGQKGEVARETGEKGVEQAKKKQKTESGEGDKTKVLEDVLKKRKVGDGGHNVLRLGRDASGGSKKKKKRRARKKRRKRRSLLAVIVKHHRQARFFTWLPSRKEWIDCTGYTKSVPERSQMPLFAGSTSS